MKEWICVQLGQYKQICEDIESHEKEGWRLHTYQVAGFGTDIKHYARAQALHS